LIVFAKIRHKVKSDQEKVRNVFFSGLKSEKSQLLCDEELSEWLLM
jgi:hypothetical protein